MEAAFTAGFARGDASITARTIAATTGPTRQLLDPAVPAQPGFAARLVPLLAIAVLAAGIAAFLYKGLSQHGQSERADAPPAQAATPVPMPAPPPAIPPPPPAPAPQPEPPRPPAQPSEVLAPDLIAALLRRGEQSLILGDIAAARLLFQHAADAGNARAALSMGKTFDPDYLAVSTAQGEKPDPARAAEWYRKAASLGDPQAADLLKRLEARSAGTKR
jgi:TPR repeat protein